MRRHHLGVPTVLALVLGATAAPAAADPDPVIGAPVPVVTQPAPVATSAPRISGKPRVGRTLEVSDGAWDVAGVELSFQWYSGGAPVPGAVYGSFDLRPVDVRRTISAVVTATHPDHETGRATATSRRVTRAGTSTKVVVDRISRPGRRVRAWIVVTSSGLAPRGTVRVRYGGRVVAKRARLYRGQVAVRLPARRPGRYRVEAVFHPARGFGDSRDRATVRVRR